MTVSFVLNGKAIELHAANPHTSLLDFLRSSGRTGSKEGCAEGECGACAVAVLGRDAAGRAAFESVNSCLFPLAAAHGRSFVSVEGVSCQNGELHPVQSALVETAGSQCGYCTPGFVVSLFCEYYRPGRTHYDEEAISGNLCRCTGYRPIIDVAKLLRKPEPSDPRVGELQGAPAALQAFEHSAAGRSFVRPTTLAGVFEYLARFPETVLIAGGTDLMVYANQRFESWQRLLSLEAVEELTCFAAGADEFTLGSALRLSELEARLSAEREFRLLQQLLPLFSSRLIRNRATLGGNLATASPIGDASPVLLALDAELTLASRLGQRRLPLSQFFVGYRKTVLAAGELVVNVHLRRAQPSFQRFYKVSKRLMDDISTVAAAFALELDDSGCVKELRIGLGGVAATPLRAERAEQFALGRPWDEANAAAIAEELATIGTPLSDARGSAAYRRAVLGNLLRKFFVDSQSPEASA